MTSKYFRPGPQNVSEKLTKATKSFKWKVFFAMFGLLFFFAVYFGLIYWFVSKKRQTNSRSLIFSFETEVVPSVYDRITSAERESGCA